MIHREDPNGLIVITQPAHSWLSGQLARHWGNEEFGEFAPAEEVCLAAEQHDIGFVPWEKAPTLDAATGRPHSFMNMPTRPHLDLWAAGVEKLLVYSRYAALLVSLHVTSLCQNNKVTRKPRDAQAIQAFLDQQHAIQSELRAWLRAEPAYAAWSTDTVIARNHQLVAAWDWISLMLCLGNPGEATIPNVPVHKGLTALRLWTSAASPAHVSISPWPFRTSTVRVICEGKRLPRTFTGEGQMHSELREAPVVTLSLELVPA